MSKPKYTFGVVLIEINIPYSMRDDHDRYQYVLDALQKNLEKFQKRKPNAEIVSVVPGGSSMPPNWHIITYKEKAGKEEPAPPEETPRTLAVLTQLEKDLRQMMRGRITNPYVLSHHERILALVADRIAQEARRG